MKLKNQRPGPKGTVEPVKKKLWCITKSGQGNCLKLFEHWLIFRIAYDVHTANTTIQQSLWTMYTFYRYIQSLPVYFLAVDDSD
jgi:hypothetical protein